MQIKNQIENVMPHAKKEKEMLKKVTINSGLWVSSDFCTVIRKQFFQV